MKYKYIQDKPYPTPMTNFGKIVRWALVIILEIISIPLFIVFSMRGHLFYALIFGIISFVVPAKRLYGVDNYYNIAKTKSPLRGKGINEYQGQYFNSSGKLYQNG